MSYPDPPADPGPAAFPAASPAAEYPALPTPLARYTLTVSSALVGAKLAIQQGGTLFISPAMWALLSTAASQAELQLLLDNIRVLKLPAFSVYSPVYTLSLSQTTGGMGEILRIMGG